MSRLEQPRSSRWSTAPTARCQADMVVHALRAGHAGTKPSHNAVFGTLPVEGARSADLAARAGDHPAVDG